MTEITTINSGRLSGQTIAILMEGDYVESEFHYYQRRFAEEGARTVLLTRLWGAPSLTFRGHEYQIPVTVDGDLEALDEQRLSEFDALVVPGGFVSDRLRYSDDTGELAPAVKLLRLAFTMPTLVKGIICHGMWLMSPIPEVARNRRVTCHNNLIADVRNMGAEYVDQDVVVDGDLVTGRSAGHCHLFARTIIDLLAHKPAAAAAGQPEAEPAAASQAPVQDGTGRYRPDFVFSDLIAGYVTGYDPDRQVIELRTSGGRVLSAKLTSMTSAQHLRNLKEPYIDASQQLGELLVPGCYLFAYGIYYPERDGYTFEAKELKFVGRDGGEYGFEEPDWWVHQIRELGHFYRRAEFGSAAPDFSSYRTNLRLGGEKTSSYVQETDTISRLVYGMSSAFMLTGEDEFLEVAQAGAQYLRDHMRFVDRDEDVVYWYHGVDMRDGAERKLFTSEFGDDYDAIPMYEQIYALAGLTQLYRVTGDEQILADINGTLRLFQKFFYDPDRGGYFSHIDPVELSPHHESLGPNRSRKNWNSIGDHAPAYLINLFLGTGEDRHADMLEDTFDLVIRHMPQPDSPFVQERFHADWTPDRVWHWQQDRAVIGHNLKIAWNLMRIMSVRPKDSYRKLALHIGETMPPLGSDEQRGGWYDVVERRLAEGESWRRFTWHDRKAWWQQEQSILAYQILTAHTGDSEFRRHARETAAFYNSFFLDHDDGGVYFNVLANGLPYLMGGERSKGSHSMSMCHAAELCYLAATYQRLLLNGDPVTMYFRPQPGGFPDRILRTAPDLLPPGQVQLDWVEVDGRPHSAFDRAAMTVKLPESDAPLTVCAHLSPTGR